uniref:Uncharacterized protein n=1 Tax=Solanum lycopersicum TaxID=4081 RepID=A0A3Q7FTD9_SOLLC
MLLLHEFSKLLVSQKFLNACKAMWMALKCESVWRPCLYMYISLALSLHIHEGMLYWYTNAKAKFKNNILTTEYKSISTFMQEIVGTISSVGAVGYLLGVLLYQNAFRNHPFCFLLYGASGLLNLILFGILDYVVAICDSAISHMIGRLRWMPLLVLSSKLCPSGIEGTFFALLTSIDHVGSLTASWAGGLLLHTLNVTTAQFDNLYIAIVIRSVLRVLPIGNLFLVPNSDPSASILPTDILKRVTITQKRTEMTRAFKNWRWLHFWLPPLSGLETGVADPNLFGTEGLPVLNRPEMHHSSQNRKLQQHQLPSEHRLRNVLLWWECSLLHTKRDQSKCQELNNLVLKGNLKIVSRTQP